MEEERTREDYLHKIGELEDVIEVQEHAIDEMQKRIDAYNQAITKKTAEIDSLYDRIAQMRELNDKMYVLFTEAQWKIRQYENADKAKRYEPFGGEE